LLTIYVCRQFSGESVLTGRRKGSNGSNTRTAIPIFSLPGFTAADKKEGDNGLGEHQQAARRIQKSNREEGKREQW
jgi:hypothetical protein